MNTENRTTEAPLCPSVISADPNCYVPTNRQRIRAYQNRLEQWLEEADASTQVAAVPATVVTAKAAPATNNISKFLRKGGAK